MRRRVMSIQRVTVVVSEGSLGVLAHGALVLLGIPR